MNKNPTHTYHDVLTRARKVWRTNDRGDHLAPHNEQYPHQWLWDGAAHAIGMRHEDAQRAAKEIEGIFVGQRESGMVPNVRMTGDSIRTRFEAWLWGNHFKNYDGPPGVKTSGITQPPIIADAMWRVGEKLDASTRREFFLTLFEPLLRYHQWIYDERTPAGDGLFAAIHPWETGQDNKLPLMQHSQTLDWGGPHMQLGAWASQLLRPDIRNTSMSERSTLREGCEQALAVMSLRRCRFDARRIRDEHPLHYQDEGLNAILIYNNTMLRRIADEIDRPLPDDLLVSMQQTENNLELLWNQKDTTYYPRDAITGEHIKVQTLSSILPLYSGVISTERQKILYDDLKNPDKFWTPYGVPNLPLDNPERRENGYWHEAWAITTWLALQGLRRIGKTSDAAQLASSTLDTMSASNMCEYFNAKNGKGLGVENFGMTALLAMDLVYTQSMDD